MSVYRTEKVNLTCNVTHPETGKVLGQVELEAHYYWWGPDEGDGWAPHEMEDQKQLTRDYRVYAQVVCPNNCIIAEGKDIDKYEVKKEL